MAQALGKAMYRGLLNEDGRVWTPNAIYDIGVLETVLNSMQSAEQELSRLEAAQDRVGPEVLEAALDSLKLRSVDQIDDSNVLQQIVTAVEEKASQVQAL